MVFVTGLVIVLFRVFICLLQTPRRIVPLVLDALIDRKRRNSDTGQAEMVGAVVVSRLGMRIGANRQTKFLRQRLRQAITVARESRSRSAAASSVSSRLQNANRTCCAPFRGSL